VDSTKLLELPFDQYQRYKIVQELINVVRDHRWLRVLDVGGHPGFIWDFLPDDEALVLDIVSWTKANYVQGQGAALPFANESFDVVLSVDTFEHIPPAQRELVLAEQLRITRDYLLLVAPFADDNVNLAERIVREFFVKRLGYRSSFLQEHLTYGLADLGESLGYLDANGVQHVEIPNGYLYNWLLMMIVLPLIQTIPDSQHLYHMINRLYNSNFYEDDNRRPCYRTAVLASKRHSLNVASILRRYEERAGEEKPDGNLKIQLANLLLNLKVEEPRVIQLQSELEERTDWALWLEGRVQEQDQYIERLQKQFEERTDWALRLDKEIGQRDGRIAQLQGEFEERTDWALRLDEELSETKQSLAEIKQSWYYKLFGRATELFRKRGASEGENESR